MCRLFRLVINHNASQKERTTIYKCLGIQVWKIYETTGESDNIVIKTYYFLGIPVTQITDVSEYYCNEYDELDEI
ncbi:MAG: hypothetical protein IJS88_03775 [Alphaproteobacteria bacterium]|nr:hypothetical protein [Alphaproteobacteria bacterium]